MRNWPYWVFITVLVSLVIFGVCMIQSGISGIHRISNPPAAPVELCYIFTLDNGSEIPVFRDDDRTYKSISRDARREHSHIGACHDDRPSESSSV